MPEKEPPHTINSTSRPKTEAAGGISRLLPRGIRGRMFLLIALSLLPLFLLIGRLFVERYNSRRAFALETELEVARGVATSFNAYLSDIRDTNFTLGQAILTFDHYTDIKATRLLSVVASQYKAIRNWNWVDLKGTVIASSSPAMAGMNLSGREYFRRVIAGESWAVGNLTPTGRVTNAPTFAVATAIRDDLGVLRGVMVAGVEPERIGEVALIQKRPSGGAYAVFDRNGLLVYRSPEMSLAWEDRERWRETDPVLQAVLSSGEEHTGATVLAVPGGVWFTARVPIPGTGWIAAAGRPEAIVLASIAQNFYRSLLVSALALALAVLFSYLIGRTIERPIRTLETAARAMGDGAGGTAALPFAPREILSLKATVEKLAEDLTSRADAIREREEQLQLAVTAARMGAYARDFLSGTDSWSPEFLAIFGLRAGEPLPLRDGIPEAVYPDDRARVLAEARERLSKTAEPEFSSEHRIIRADGEVRWVLIRGRVEFAADGTPTGSRGFALDMTERKRGEEALRRYELLAQHSRDIVLFMNSGDGSIVEANTAAETAYGYSRKELLTLSIHDLRFPETRGETVTQMAKAGSEGLLFETVHKRKDGSTFPVEVSSQGALIDGRRMLLSVIRDISERKRTEKALELSNEKFAKAFDSNPAAIVLSRASDGLILAVNLTWETLFGYGREETIGRSSASFDLWVYPEERDRGVRELMEKGSFRNLERTLKRKSGEHFAALSSAEILTVSDERVVLSTWLDITERKRAEEVLHRQAALIDLSYEAIFTWELNGPILSWNRGAEQLYGWSAVEAVGRMSHELLDTRHPEGIEAFLTALARTGVWTGELVHRTKDGRSLTVESRHQLVEDGSGKRIVLEITRDVSDRRRVEEALRESERRYRALADSMPQLVWTAQADGTVDYYNSKVRDYGGFTRNPDGSWRWGAVLHPEDRKRTEAAFQSALKTGDVYEAEHRVLMADGSYRWHLSRGEPVRDGEGRIVKWYGTATDIQELKEIQEELAKVASFPEQSANPVLRLSSEGKLLYANPAAGKSLETWNGRPGDLTLPREIVDAGMTALETGGRSTIEFAVSDSEIYLVDLLSSSDRTYVNIYCRDITELKKIELALKAAKEQAEAANRAKTEFLASMSHELRTPIGGIIGMAELLLPKLSDSPFAHHVSLIRDSGRTLLGVIGDVLDLSQIESGKIELSEREFSVRSLVESCIEQFSLSAHQAGLHLSFEIDPALSGSFRGDSDKIGQILRNFISNAIKYTERGSISVRVRANRRADEGIEALFRIADTGLGIPQDKLDYIFHEFTRILPETGVVKSGTGLGLAIAKRLVHLLGGELCLESEVGKGSAFYFTVPLKPSPGTGNGPGEPEAAQETRPLSILLAEDTLVNRLFLETVLREAGHAVSIVGNGQEAVEAVAHERFDLVLMDIQMPELDGLEATKQIRALQCGWHNLPIVALTAYAMRGDRERMLSAGMDEYVTKPVDIPHLLEVIHRVAQAA